MCKEVCHLCYSIDFPELCINTNRFNNQNVIVENLSYNENFLGGFNFCSDFIIKNCSQIIHVHRNWSNLLNFSSLQGHLFRF